MFGTILCRVFVVVGLLSILLLPSGGYAETSTTYSSVFQRVPVQAEQPVMGAMRAHDLSTPLAVSQAAEDKAVEPSMRLLRSDATRYPDHDLAGRFVEMSTELPPMFGGQE